MAEADRQVIDSCLSRPQRIRHMPAHLASPSNTHFHHNAQRNYNLNRDKAIEKKLEACQRPLMETKIAAGNNIVIKLSTATYELFKKACKPFFDVNESYIAEITLNKDKTNLITEEVFRIKNRLKNGSAGKSNKYTFNLYHTTSTILANGREAKSTFLDDHLPKIIRTIQCNKSMLDQLNKEIETALASFRSENKQKSREGKSKISSHKENRTPVNQIAYIVSSTDEEPKIRQQSTSMIQYDSKDSVDIPENQDESVCLCPLCVDPVLADDKAVECSQCTNWYHYKCLDISLQEIQELESDETIRFQCMTCKIQDDQITHVQETQSREEKDDYPCTRSLPSISSLTVQKTCNNSDNLTSHNTSFINSCTSCRQLTEKESKLKEKEQILNQKEKGLNKKEKDLKKLELDYNEKINQIAARKAYIAKLETQVKELQQSNHLMKIQLAAGQSIKDNSESCQQKVNASSEQIIQHNTDSKSSSASIEFVQNHCAIKTLESKLDSIDRVHRLEIDILKQRISQIELQNVSHKQQRTTSKPNIRNNKSYNKGTTYHNAPLGNLQPSNLMSKQSLAGTHEWQPNSYFRETQTSHDTAIFNNMIDLLEMENRNNEEGLSNSISKYSDDQDQTINPTSEHIHVQMNKDRGDETTSDQNDTITPHLELDSLLDTTINQETATVPKNNHLETKTTNQSVPTAHTTHRFLESGSHKHKKRKESRPRNIVTVQQRQPITPGLMEMHNTPTLYYQPMRRKIMPILNNQVIMRPNNYSMLIPTYKTIQTPSYIQRH